MTIDKAIIDCREVAEIHEQKMKQCDSASGFTRSHNASIRTTDAKRHEVKAKEYYQLAEWLKDYKRLKEQEPCKDAISREKAKQFLYERIDRLNDDDLYDIFSKIIDDMYNELPSVTPQPKTDHCKDCKWWKDKDGVYRRGIGAESKCLINSREVFEGNGYCYMFSLQESEEK